MIKKPDDASASTMVLKVNSTRACTSIRVIMVYEYVLDWRLYHIHCFFRSAGNVSEVGCDIGNYSRTTSKTFTRVFLIEARTIDPVLVSSQTKPMESFPAWQTMQMFVFHFYEATSSYLCTNFGLDTIYAFLSSTKFHRLSARRFNGCAYFVFATCCLSYRCINMTYVCILSIPKSGFCRIFLEESRELLTRRWGKNKRDSGREEDPLTRHCIEKHHRDDSRMEMPTAYQLHCFQKDLWQYPPRHPIEHPKILCGISIDCFIDRDILQLNWMQRHPQKCILWVVSSELWC